MPITVFTRARHTLPTGPDDRVRAIKSCLLKIDFNIILTLYLILRDQIFLICISHLSEMLIFITRPNVTISNVLLVTISCNAKNDYYVNEKCERGRIC
jgi:hypothetical protein